MGDSTVKGESKKRNQSPWIHSVKGEGKWEMGKGRTKGQSRQDLQWIKGKADTLCTRTHANKSFQREGRGEGERRKASVKREKETSTPKLNPRWTDEGEG